MKKSHTENTVGPWARQKLDGLEAYLSGYTTALKKQPFELIYIDAFAGAGRSKLRDGWAGADADDVSLLDEDILRAEELFVEGSPRRALGLAKPFRRYFFFDADPGRVAVLGELKAEYPTRDITICVGDGNYLVQSIVPKLCGKMVRGIAFLDPYGPHLNWQTLEVLAQTKKFEVVVNFPLGMAINRLITRSGEIPESWRDDLDACFGGNEWERLVYAETTDLFGDTILQKVDDAGKRLLTFYAGRLEALFGCVASPSVVRNSRGMPIYYMLWAGPNPLGRKIAEHVLSKGDRITPPKNRWLRSSLR